MPPPAEELTQDSAAHLVLALTVGVQVLVQVAGAPGPGPGELEVERIVRLAANILHPAHVMIIRFDICCKGYDRRRYARRPDPQNAQLRTATRIPSPPGCDSGPTKRCASRTVRYPADSGRKAKFYRIIDQGRRRLRAETREFASFLEVVTPILLGS